VCICIGASRIISKNVAVELCLRDARSTTLYLHNAYSYNPRRLRYIPVPPIKLYAHGRQRRVTLLLYYTSSMPFDAVLLVRTTYEPSREFGRQIIHFDAPTNVNPKRANLFRRTNGPIPFRRRYTVFVVSNHTALSLHDAATDGPCVFVLIREGSRPRCNDAARP